MWYGQYYTPVSNAMLCRCYNTTLRGIIPLPDMTAPPDSASHLNAYPEFMTGSTVMALYPDTSCFYRAEVLESPTVMARVSGHERLNHFSLTLHTSRVTLRQNRCQCIS